MKTKFNNKGITLIALVITIIVLLILAGVSIATLVGENGLLTKAQNVKNINDFSMIKEAILLKQAEKVGFDDTEYIGIPYTDENSFGPINIWGYETVFGDGWYKINESDLKKLGVQNVQGEYVVNYINGYVIKTESWIQNGEKVYTTDKVSIKEIAPGGIHTYILRSDGTLWTTGDNRFGSLGIGNNENKTTFTQIKITNIKKVYAGIYSTFAIKENGNVYAWGLNNSGQLGIGNNENQFLPTKVNIDNVEEISPGWNHALLKKTDGTIWGCGVNLKGNLGLGDNVNRNVFTKIDISNVKKVIAGASDAFSTVLKNDGTVWTTGSNTSGALGLGDNLNRNIFTKTNMDNVKDIMSYNSNIIIKNDGTVWGCGRNDRGELGIGNIIDKNTFQKVDIEEVEKISGMYSHMFATKKDGNIYGWGMNRYNFTSELAENLLIPNLMPYTSIKQVIAAGQSATIIHKMDGAIWGRGDNKYGELGVGTTEENQDWIEIKFIK